MAPVRDVYTAVSTGENAYADLVIEPSDAIDVIGTRSPMMQDYTFVSLESISYRR